MIEEKNQNRIAETEELSSEERGVSRMLGSLKRVAAPKDFDFRLKARIANASVSDYRPSSLIPILRYSLPLCLVLFVGAMFVFNNTSDSGEISKAPKTVQPTSVASKPVEVPAPPVNKVENPVETVRIPSLVPLERKSTQFISGVNRKARSVPAKIIVIPEATPRVSVDSALSAPPEVINPPGINPDAGKQSDPQDFTVKPIGIRQALSEFGIEADFENDAWKVKSLTKGGLAERSGVQNGDLLESIDDRRIDDRTVYTGSFSTKSMKVKRGGTTVQINLTNK